MLEAYHTKARHTLKVDCHGWKSGKKVGQTTKPQFEFGPGSWFTFSCPCKSRCLYISIEVSMPEKQDVWSVNNAICSQSKIHATVFARFLEFKLLWNNVTEQSEKKRLVLFITIIIMVNGFCGRRKVNTLPNGASFSSCRSASSMCSVGSGLPLSWRLTFSMAERQLVSMVSPGSWQFWSSAVASSLVSPVWLPGLKKGTVTSLVDTQSQGSICCCSLNSFEDVSQLRLARVSRSTMLSRFFRWRSLKNNR